MIELRKVHGDNIPEVIEYLGMNEEPTYDSFVSKVR